jgi:FkbM family methyltransferase
MPSFAKQVAARLGYELKRQYGDVAALDFLETLMLGAMAVESPLQVVQVGANDGSISDPIYRFMSAHRERTAALLIEPQPELIPYLREAYAEHPAATVHNGAIGSGDSLKLYRIRPELWESFRVSYLKGAPAYRAPSGLTSGNRAHVLAAAGKHLSGTATPEEAVEEIAVPCSRLAALVDALGFSRVIHLLQVDAEGADDQVLYACDVDTLRPSIINFESKHLDAGRYERLAEFLSGQGYTLYRWNKSDTVALRLSG